MLVIFMPIRAGKRDQGAVGDGRLLQLAIEVPSPNSEAICTSHVKSRELGARQIKKRRHRTPKSVRTGAPALFVAHFSPGLGSTSEAYVYGECCQHAR
jgi:hypothetical protein